VTPAAKAEALFRLARSTTIPAERDAALAQARAILVKYHLHVTVDGRVVARPTKPPPASDLWDTFAERTKKFLASMLDASREAASHPPPAPAPSSHIPWDLRDAERIAPPRANAARRRPRRRGR